MLRIKHLCIPALLVLAASCSKKAVNEKGKIIPADAAMVMHLDMKSLGSKVSMDDIKATSFFQHALQAAGDNTTAELLQNPALMGVNLEGDLFAFIQQPAGYDRYVVFNLPLKDVATFEKLLAKAPGRLEPKKQDQFKYIVSGGGRKMIAAWTNDRLLIATEMPEERRYRRREYGDETDRDKTKTPLQYAAYLFNLGTSASMGVDKRFGKMMEEKGDIHLYFSMAGLTNISGDMPPGMPKDFFEDNYGAYTFNFDKGRINLDIKQYFSSATTKLYKKYNTGNIEAAALNKLPVNNPAVAVAVKFNPQVVPAVIREWGIESILKMEGAPDFTDIAKAFNGDFSFALGNMTPADSLQALKKRFLDKMAKGGDESFDIGESFRNPYDFFVSAGINDAAAFERLNMLLGLGRQMDDEDAPRLVTGKAGNTFMLASRQPLLDQFKNGSGHSQPYSAEFVKHPMGIYINVNQLANYYHHTSTLWSDHEDEGDAGTWSMLQPFKEIYFVGGEFEGDAMVAKGWLTLADANINALKQVIKLADLYLFYGLMNHVETEPKITEIPPGMPVDVPPPPPPPPPPGGTPH